MEGGEEELLAKKAALDAQVAFDEAVKGIFAADAEGAVPDCTEQWFIVVLIAALAFGLNEGASVWCWGASASLLTMVVEPAVAQRLEARGEMARRRPAKARSRADRAALSLWLAIRGPGRFVDANFGENGEGGSFALL